MVFSMRLGLLCLLWPVMAFGQSLKGRITDAQQVPLQNAHVFHLQSGAHTHSNGSGTFLLPHVSLGDTLVVSHVGYTQDTMVVEEWKGLWEIQLEEASIKLQQIIISTQLQTLDQIAAIDLKTNPVQSSQEFLRKVPGLLIGQHAGGGKAEQIFLRGFDVDHGTDINISADGIPVNMVSHAHGQGYADLHFLIPETIKDIQYGKGTYEAAKGNFATAGYVDFHTYDRLDKNSIALEYGSFNRLRTVGMFNLLGDSSQQGAYLAGEYLLSDGPFESPQHFNRLNLMGKYFGSLRPNEYLTLEASYFDSQWNASGQIPQRAVEEGQISRFGAIDDTEGGHTSRTNILVKHQKMVKNNAFVTHKIFYTHYDFELYSNFTFFLNDPVRGDQIRQKEKRNMVGLESVFHQNQLLGSHDFYWQSGIGFRYDAVQDVELSHTANRKTMLDPLALGDVNESNLYGFISAEFEAGRWLFNPGLRLDYFKFDYYDQLDSVFYTASERKVFAAPKFNIVFTPNPRWQLYAKSGVGFHSNDTRVVVQQAKEILPAAYGTDLGTVWKVSDQWLVNLACWYLFLQQEFVYVGDEGVIEPSGKTRRKGVDLSIRYQLNPALFLDADFNYAHARAIEAPEGQSYIPLAPSFTATGGVSWLLPSGLSGSLRYCYLHDRPANEDHSLVAQGYFVTDANIHYSFRQWSLSLIAENLFNTDWKETQFETTSRLRDEPSSVTEIHFTPGSPFNLRAKVSVSF